MQLFVTVCNKIIRMDLDYVTLCKVIMQHFSFLLLDSVTAVSCQRISDTRAQMQFEVHRAVCNSFY